MNWPLPGLGFAHRWGKCELFLSCQWDANSHTLFLRGDTGSRWSGRLWEWGGSGERDLPSARGLSLSDREKGRRWISLRILMSYKPEEKCLGLIGLWLPSWSVASWKLGKSRCLEQDFRRKQGIENVVPATRKTNTAACTVQLALNRGCLGQSALAALDLELLRNGLSCGGGGCGSARVVGPRSPQRGAGWAVGCDTEMPCPSPGFGWLPIAIIERGSGGHLQSQWLLASGTGAGGCHRPVGLEGQG